MNYVEAVRRLYSLTRFGMKPGLETTRRLAALAGNPQDRLKFIHVAGTNGKGSTCAFLENVYRAAGLRVGLYTSPHLVSFRERVQIDREPITETEVARLLERLRELAASDGLEPTFFEFITVMALMRFAELGCDLVVLETGMGGRLDSTNIVQPLVSVITPIGMDHAAYLGDTLEQIAGEKAGIIKTATPVISAPQTPEVAEVLRQRAEQVDAPIRFVEATSLTANYRRSNARLAADVVRVLNESEKLPTIDEPALSRGLKLATWPGRLQLIQRADRCFLLDGAHNADGLRALLAALPEFAPPGKRELILGVLADKEVGPVIPELGAAFDRIALVPIASSRAGDPATRMEEFRGHGVNVILADSLTRALEQTTSDFVVIAGSFYLIGEALERFEAVPAGLRSERELNEYGR